MISDKKLEHSILLEVENIPSQYFEAKADLEDPRALYHSISNMEDSNFRSSCGDRLSTSVSQFSPGPPSTSETPHVKEQFSKAVRALVEKPSYNSKNELTCRDQEKQKVELFLLHCLNIMGKTSIPSLYICGVPGIGKTLTMTTISQWFTKQHAGQVRCVYLNGMEMRRVSKVYSIILKKLARRKSKKPCYYLHLLLTQSKKYPYPEDIALLSNQLKLLIIDEIDYFLEDKYQPLLYNFLEWSSHLNAKLVLVGLSNTVNFVQKLNSKINSRMYTSVNLLFQVYTSQQVEIILATKLQKYTYLFHKDSLKMISKKICGFSSDIRAALHLCEKSLNLALEESLSEGRVIRVSESHIRASIEPRAQFQILKGLATIYKLILLVLCSVGESHSQDDSQLITSKFSSLCERNEIEVRERYHVVRKLLFDLKAMQIIEMKGLQRGDKDKSSHMYFERWPIYLSPETANFISTCEEFELLK